MIVVKSSQPRLIVARPKLNLQRTLLPILLITVFPTVIARQVLRGIWDGRLSRAWDGTGHYAIAQIYDQTIFPDTFGWVHGYFGGMPFPNFYPPAYYWLIAFLHHAHILKFSAAFKVVTVLPVLILPAMMWLLGWRTSDKSHLVAFMVALASFLLLTNIYFQPLNPSGLNYFSTFQIGLYTQPLGFVLLIGWYVTYLNAHEKRWKFALSCLLLALVVLANFFNAIVAVILIAATVVAGLWQHRGSKLRDDEKRRVLLSRLLSPVIAICLSLFWLAPMLKQYPFFVTRPYTTPMSALMTPVLWGWYAVAVIGSMLWLFRRTQSALGFLGGCIFLLAGLLLAPHIAPGWFPLQPPRFLSTLTFLLAVPIGYLLAAAIRLLASMLLEAPKPMLPLNIKNAPFTVGAVTMLLLLLLIISPSPPAAYAFYQDGESEDIQAMLDFAREHRDGRYLVGVLNPEVIDLSFDARAINSYLGSQNNQSLGGVFHEASPNSLFALPLINAFSERPDSYGISSLLSDDIDFGQQSLERHLDRARSLGVKYLVLRNESMKRRILELREGIENKYDFGRWSIFELNGDIVPPVRILKYKPALVVSSFTVKQRGRDEYSFIRLAEEQFADDWFEVLLARSEETRIDRIRELQNFAALIIDTYDYENIDAAFQALKRFAEHSQLILLEARSPLFERVRASRQEFRRLEILERPATGPGEALGADNPSHSYNSSDIRQTWIAIRKLLEGSKVAVSNSSLTVGLSDQSNSTVVKVQMNPASSSEVVPIALSTTFHPNWARDDEQPTYAVTPFYTLTFAHTPITLRYQRTWPEVFALAASVVTLFLLGGSSVWFYLPRTRTKHP